MNALNRLLKSLFKGAKRLDSAGPVGLLVAVLVLALLLPLAFYDEDGASGEGSSGGKNEDKYSTKITGGDIFSDYWLVKGGTTAEVLNEVDAEVQEKCRSFAETLCSLIYDENKPTADKFGMQYSRVSLVEGKGEIKLCRLWCEWRGDWQNWIDAFYDFETGEIYYLYISCECLENRGRYGDAPSLTAKLAAEELGDFCAFDLIRFIDGPNPVAVYANGRELRFFNIDCTYYPSTLVDIKICAR